MHIDLLRRNEFREMEYPKEAGPYEESIQQLHSDLEQENAKLKTSVATTECQGGLLPETLEIRF